MALLEPLETGSGTEAQAAFLTERPRNQLFRTLAWNPELGRAAAQLGGRLMTSQTLPPRLRELAAVRAGRFRADDYVVQQHRRVGRDVGLTEAELDAAEGLSEAPIGNIEQAVLDFVAGACSGATNYRAGDALLHHLGPAALCELALVAGYFSMLATVSQALDVALEL